VAYGDKEDAALGIGIIGSILGILAVLVVVPAFALVLGGFDESSQLLLLIFVLAFPFLIALFVLLRAVSRRTGERRRSAEALTEGQIRRTQGITPPGAPTGEQSLGEPHA
jgi:Na+/melibiose symporter-like transporter